MARIDSAVRLLLLKAARVLEGTPMSEEQSDLYCDIRAMLDYDDKNSLRLVSGEVCQIPEETL